MIDSNVASVRTQEVVHVPRNVHEASATCSPGKTIVVPVIHQAEPVLVSKRHTSASATTAPGEAPIPGKAKPVPKRRKSASTTTAPRETVKTLVPSQAKPTSKGLNRSDMDQSDLQIPLNLDGLDI
jgi:hypothetical protein